MKKQKDERVRRLFFTSDLWIFSTDVENYQRCDGEKRFEKIAEEWNKEVNKGDIVFVLGNLCCDPKEYMRVLNALNGNIVLIASDMDRKTITLSESILEYLMQREDMLKRCVGDEFGTMYATDQLNLLPMRRLLEYYEGVIEKSQSDAFIVTRGDMLELPTHSIVLTLYKCDEWNGSAQGSLNLHGGTMPSEGKSYNISAKEGKLLTSYTEVRKYFDE